MTSQPTLFIGSKVDAEKGKENALLNSFQQIERWSLTLTGGGGGGGYASLTGPGQTTTPGDLTQAGGFFVNDNLGSGISLYQPPGASGGGGIVIETDAASGNIDINAAHTAININAPSNTLTLNGTQVDMLSIGGTGINITDQSPSGLSIAESGSGGITIHDSGSGGTFIHETGIGGISIFATVSAISIQSHGGGSWTELSGGGIQLNNSGSPGTTGIQILDTSTSGVLIQETGLGSITLNSAGGGPIKLGVGPTQKIAFFGVTGAALQTITGSRSGNIALANLMTALNALGIVGDSTTP